MAVETSFGPVTDTDAHVTEPADLWTSRVAQKWRSQAPRVEFSPVTGHHHWRIGDRWIQAVGYHSSAGFKDYPPFSPWEFEEIDPATFDPAQRLVRLDEYGIRSQVIYPNLIGFQSPLFIELGPELSLLCTRAYNDFILEWTSTDSQRLVPLAMVPYWDPPAAVKEIERCKSTGHRGLLFANKYEKLGLPSMSNKHWDEIYAVAQEMEMPINFHSSFASPQTSRFLSLEQIANPPEDLEESRRSKAGINTTSHLSNYEILVELLTSGLCERFPSLKFVSVESGFGYVPFLLDALDWHWKNKGAVLHSAMLPSEYFKRQCYGTFCYETSTLRLLDLFPDNFMFSTDYPHQSSIAPGPASSAELPRVHVERAFKDLPDDVVRKALYGNAAALYGLATEGASE